MEVYEIQTFGGQIIADQEPRPVRVPAPLEATVKNDIARFGHFWTDGARYYPTRERARAAVRWALAN